MHKSTIILGCTSVILAATTVVVTWQLLSDTPQPQTAPLAGGANIELGIPGVAPNDRDPVFSAKSALLYDGSSDRILFEQDAFDRRPIASITKLMTAMVALDHGIEWNRKATIEPDEYVQGGRLLLHPGEHVTMKDLFTASLLGSANNATLAYVRELGIQEDDFVDEMNRKAIELGLEQTTFTDVTGLDEGNVSTAYEAARMAYIAYTQYPNIAKTSSQAEYTFTVGGTGRVHTIRNTNKLVSEWDETVTGSKTGFLYEAGYCLVMKGTGEHKDRVSVILGSPTASEHFADSRRLMQLEVP